MGDSWIPSPAGGRWKHQTRTDQGQNSRGLDGWRPEAQVCLSGPMASDFASFT
jgi:hypothetical protein